MASEQVLGLLGRSRSLLVITGAGISAPSGIETYRDAAGEWQRPAPVNHQDFVNRHQIRQRYWARSMRGWPMFETAQPNPAHLALVRLEQLGIVRAVVTQNVDGLHQRAGQGRVYELHGTLAEVCCLDCGSLRPRPALQQWLEARNARFTLGPAVQRPDGDAELTDVGVFDDFEVPGCECGGILKPNVVFYGDSVPGERVAAIRRELAAADGLLVVGSSLMVYSSYRFVKEAHARGLPLAAVNLGRTRADEWFALQGNCKLEADCAVAMPDLVSAL